MRLDSTPPPQHQKKKKEKKKRGTLEHEWPCFSQSGNNVSVQQQWSSLSGVLRSFFVVDRLPPTPNKIAGALDGRVASILVAFALAAHGLLWAIVLVRGLDIFCAPIFSTCSGANVFGASGI